ncbi:MAG TPA: twin-arginine translocation signal domain-containing protein, partial [Cyclobacteriaceae bacterium]|nr:twin-arginine translocation signal domain-containing protein [Cyclobacteriaceae bacterium]
MKKDQSNRRGFIKGTLQAAAGMAIAALPAEIAAKEYMMSNRPVESTKKMQTPSSPSQSLRFS